MEFLKLGNGGRLNSAVYHKLIHNIVHSETTNGFLLDLLVSKYFEYIDVRYFTYISLEKISRTLEEKDISGTDGKDENNLREGTEHLIHNIHSILSRIPAQEGSVDASEMLSDCSPVGESKSVSAEKKDEKR